MDRIDVELLKLLPETSEKARALLESLSVRERGMAETQYHVAKTLVRNKKIPFDRSDFKEIGSVLTQCGVGEFEPKGHYRSFKWKYNLVSVANIALGKKDIKDLAERPKMKGRPLPEVDLTKVRPPEDNFPITSVGFKLGDSIIIKKNGWTVELAFQDITLDKCKKLALVLQNIPRAS